MAWRVVTLNRPQALNALSRELLDELARTIDALAADPHVRVLILTGAGRAILRRARFEGAGLGPCRHRQDHRHLARRPGGRAERVAASR